MCGSPLHLVTISAFYKYGSYEVTVIPAKPFQGFPSFMLEEKDPSPSNAPIFAQTVVRWKQRQSVLAKTGTRSHSYLPMTDALQNVLNDIENSTIYSDALYVPIGHLFDPNIHVIPQFVVPLTSVQAFFNSYASLLAVEELQKWQDLSKVDQDLFRVFFEQCKKEQESQLVCGWVRIKKLEPVFPVQHALEETTGTSYRIAVESIQRRKRAVPTFSACSQLDDMLVERLEKRRRMT
uniref:Uncharacterized protein n=1 Tax=Caenorhabditis japonica TaxID=281687 RepID=A0A8R1IAJ6_CAEJA